MQDKGTRFAKKMLYPSVRKRRFRNRAWSKNAGATLLDAGVCRESARSILGIFVFMHADNLSLSSFYFPVAIILFVRFFTVASSHLCFISPVQH